MRSQINVYSKKVVHRLTKISNTPTFLTHILIQIMYEIFLRGALPPQEFTYYMLTSFTGDTRNNMKLTEVFPMQKQRQFIQACEKKTGL